ncbi:hypothetical protein ACB289_22140, partial [Aeromonas caviae]
ICRPYYLIHPNGLPPTKECAYGGFGAFGGVISYECLGLMNAPEFCLSSALTAPKMATLWLDVLTDCFSSSLVH